MDSRFIRKEEPNFCNSIERPRNSGFAPTSFPLISPSENFVLREHCESLPFVPFHIHSLTPPVDNTTSHGFLSGRKCSKRMASIRRSEERRVGKECRSR